MLAGSRAGARVDDEQRDLRVGEPRLRLLANRAGERVLVGEVDASGVDQRERAPVPLALELLAVARDPGRSCTIASREPLSRFTSEDLPTFG